MLQDLQDYRIVSFKASCCLQILFLPYFYLPQTITLTVIFDRSNATKFTTLRMAVAPMLRIQSMKFQLKLRDEFAER